MRCSRMELTSEAAAKGQKNVWCRGKIGSRQWSAMAKNVGKPVVACEEQRRETYQAWRWRRCGRRWQPIGGPIVSADGSERWKG